LRAIRLHTLGSTDMRILDKIVYVADHTEEGRDHHGVKKIRKLAKSNIDLAVSEIASSMIKYLLSKGLPVHPGAYEVRNRYLKKHDKKK
jgi:HD superfamily phosphohydrolase YqeK